MRENQFLGILALILALGMPLTLELFALITQVAEGKIFDAEVSTETELITALASPDILRISLHNDIVTTENLKITRHVILDLNGFNITSLKANVSVIDIKHGSVILTGRGSIVAYGLKGVAVRIKGATTSDNENYAEVLIDQHIKLFAPNHYGLLVAPNFKAAYGVTVEFYGSMVAQDGFCISENVRGRGKNIPLIKIADQTKITVDEHSGIAIHAAGYGRWEIGNSKITGATGIAAQSGNLVLQDTKIIATGEFVEPDLTSADRITMIGAVIQSAAITHEAHSAEITINGGEYTSLRSYLFAETCAEEATPALQMLVIEDGEFAGKLGTFYGLAPRNTEHAVTVVYGGNFTDNVQDYISSSCHLQKEPETGSYLVIEDETVVEVDEATRLARAEGQLEALMETAKEQIADCHVHNLGKWKPVATKAIASIKRAITLSKKALKSHAEYERLVSAEASLGRALDGLGLVKDGLRTELAESVASVEAIDQRDYTTYSYQQLLVVVKTAKAMLDDPATPLEDLYSAILDIEINIDLLDDIDDDALDLDSELDSTSAALEELAADQTSLLLNPDPELDTLPLQPLETSSMDVVSPSSTTLSPADILQSQTLITSLLLTQFERFFPAGSSESNSELLSGNQTQASELLNSAEPLASSHSGTLSTVDSPTQPSFSPSPSPAQAQAQTQPQASPAAVATPTAYVEPISPETNAAYILSHSIEYPAEAALLEAKSNLYSMLEAVQSLTVNDYEPEFAEQFGELQVTVAKARTVLYKPRTTFVELMTVMDELTTKTTGLKGFTELPETSSSAVEDIDDETLLPSSSSRSATTLEKAVQIDWTALSEVVAEISRLNPNDFTATSYARLLSQLEPAKSMLANPHVTQSAVEDLVFDINLALLGLERVAAPATSNVTTPNIISYNSPDSTLTPADPTVTPNLIMSMLAGAYAGMATYRRSRLLAKKQKHSTV